PTYVAHPDSGCNFGITAGPPGSYRVWAIQDENNNRRPDRREAFDTVTLTVDSSASALLWAFVHDTVGPRVRTVEPIDSVDFRVAFSAPLDPRRALDTARVRVLALPDSTPVAVRALYTPAVFDSIQARARAVQDSLKRLRDTTHRDTTARAGARPPAAQRAPAVGRAPAAPSRPDTSAPKVDTARVRKLLSERPVPYDHLVVQTTQPLAPGGQYLLRVRGANGGSAPPEGWSAAIRSRVRRLAAPSLGPVINATGVVLHTNLGRAPLAQPALAALARVGATYSNLEYDLLRGARGSRHGLCRDLLVELTGAEDAVVVNNAAGAVLVALSALARGGEAIVSRGELVEIGGAFRIPDIMARSGATLVEGGTTNRTHLKDYENALTPASKLLLKVHQSNLQLT